MKDLLDSLHPLERKVLPVIDNGISLPEISKKSELSDVEVVRALQWMENRGILKTEKSEKDLIDLDSNGKIYLKKGLPEKNFLKVLDKEKTLKEIADEAHLDNDEVKICIGVLKRKAAIAIIGDKVSPTSKRDLLLSKDLPEEVFLKKLPMDLGKLDDDEISFYKILSKRKNIVIKKTEKIISVDLTPKGKTLKKDLGNYSENLEEKVTPKMLRDGSFEGIKFRRYDVEINVPKIFGGKRHFVNQAVEYSKRIWLDLGFKEMSGPLLQTSFWNFDALFTAQDHPVRDLQDTYYIESPAKGKLPKGKIVNNVKETHENGWSTGSHGWRYKWDPEDAKKNCLRTHTTVLSAKTISSLKLEDLPAKYFSVGKCFRNETMDWSHLFEFYQVEGIVVDPNANFKQLLGYLTTFFRKMGYQKVRVRPGYFPYTEMSAEVDVYDETRKKWIELAGSGIFRPEVVKPLLGKDVPVLAWGLGFPRTISEYYKIKDIRNIYKNDLKQLKETKIWMV